LKILALQGVFIVKIEKLQKVASLQKRFFLIPTASTNTLLVNNIYQIHHLLNESKKLIFVYNNAQKKYLIEKNYKNLIF